MVHVSWLFFNLGIFCSYTTGPLADNHLIAPLGHLVLHSTGHLSSSHVLPIFCFNQQRNKLEEFNFQVMVK